MEDSPEQIDFIESIHYIPNEAEQPYWTSFLQSIEYLQHPEVYHVDSGDYQKVKSAGLFMMQAVSNKEPRFDRSPSSSHPIEAARILADYHLPAKALVYALLHDVSEDTDITVGELGEIFGQDIIPGLGYISQAKRDFTTDGIVDEEGRDRRLRTGLIKSLVDEPFATLARCAERLHNLRTIGGLLEHKPESARRTVRESLDVYVPLLLELGMYEMAHEVTVRSLRVLYPDALGKIETEHSSFSPTTMEQAVDLVSQQLGFSPEQSLTRIRVYSPHYERLWWLFRQGISLEKYSHRDVALEFPINLDIFFDGSPEQTWSVYKRLISSRFVPEGFSMHKLPKYLIDGNLVNESLTYLMEMDSQKFAPVAVSVLTPDTYRRRYASIRDAFTVDMEIDESMRKEGILKIHSLQERVGEAISEDSTREVARLLAALEGRLMRVNVEIDGREVEVNVRDDATIFDVVAAAVSDVDFLHIASITKDGEVITTSDQYRESTSFSDRTISIHTDPEAIYASPNWLGYFRTDDTGKAEYLMRVFGEILDENFIQQFEGQGQEKFEAAFNLQQRIRKEAENRGRSILNQQFFLHARLPRRLSVTYGFTDELMARYGEEPANFLVDVGIDVIPYGLLNDVIRRLSEARERLIVVRVDVPSRENKPGWLARVVDAIAYRGYNTIEGEIYSDDTENVSATIEVYVVPPEDFSRSAVLKILGSLDRDIRSRTHAKFGKEPQRIIFTLPKSQGAGQYQRDSGGNFGLTVNSI
ncbi:HD domain-containing protein [Candidatus Gottesmanbacteria bacterium]|nr:HD domain-containing protein [Candidatus Gottesmanbacteria bacterium]